uniref:Uncharacterized protein n=1 Tax=Rhizophora mucronata TaxID=61149 RepID=A0A2P2IQN7_RHIMU
METQKVIIQARTYEIIFGGACSRPSVCIFLSHILHKTSNILDIQPMDCSDVTTK